MLTQNQQSNLKAKIKSRMMVQCDQCCKRKFKKEFSYLNTHLGNICKKCQELDNY